MTKRRLGAACCWRLAASLACRRGAAPAAAPAERPNVLLVTIDTLRADRVGCYGHASASTPVLDALAARGVRFETAIAHVPLTGPSHASILTGLTPLGHGFRDNGGFVLPAQAKSAAEDFRQAGYRTAAFVSGFPLDRRFGFDRGFETYDDHLPKGNDPRRDASRRALRRRHHRRRAALARRDRGVRAAPPPRSSSGSTTTTPTRRTSPRATSPRASGPRPTTARWPSWTSSSGGSSAALEERGVLARTLRRRDVGPRREPRRARRGHPRPLRLRLDAQGPLHRGRARHRAGTRRADRRARHRRAADAPRLRRAEAAPRDRGPLAPPGHRGAGDERRPGLRRDALPAARAGLGAAVRLAHRAAQDDRGARGPSCTTSRRTPGRPRTARGARTPASRRCGRGCRPRSLAPAPSAAAEVDPETAERLRALGYVGGGGGARRVAGAALRDPKDGVRLLPGLNKGMMAVRTEPAVAIRELHGRARGGPGPLRGPPLAGHGLRLRRAVREGHRRAAAAREGEDASAPRTRSCSATTCASRAVSTRRGGSRETAARTRASPSPGSPWPRSTSRRQARRGRRGLRARPRRSRPTTSRRSGASATWPSSKQAWTRRAAATRASSRSSRPTPGR